MTNHTRLYITLVAKYENLDEYLSMDVIEVCNSPF